MLTRRIIPCLDVREGRTVKGVNFVGLRDAGDPVELAARYAAEGADEIAFLDIAATVEGRATLADLVRRVARNVDVPITVGGGIGSEQDVERLLAAGADKVSINSAAVRTPELVDRLARHFGSQCVVLAVDADRDAAGRWHVVTHGGRTPTDLDALAWAREGADRGAGEVLLTAMTADGTRAGFALDLTGTMARALTIPVIASGGAGTTTHFADVLEAGAAAALAASVFHFGQIRISDLKRLLAARGLPIRLDR